MPEDECTAVISRIILLNYCQLWMIVSQAIVPGIHAQVHTVPYLDLKNLKPLQPEPSKSLQDACLVPLGSFHLRWFELVMLGFCQDY